MFSSCFAEGRVCSYNAARWRGWSIRWDAWEDNLDVLLFFILYILITRGVVRDLKQVHFLTSLLGPSLAGGLETPAAAEEISLKNLKEISAYMTANKCKGGGSMLLVAEILSNTTSRKLGHVTRNICAPMEDQMGIDLHTCNTLTGRVEFHKAMACNRAVQVCKDTWLTLNSAKFLSRCYFLRPEDVRGPECLREDCCVAEYAFSFCVHIMAREFASTSFYDARPPFNCLQFFGSAEEKAGILAWLKEIAEALDVVMPKYQHDALLREIIDATLWIHSPFCAEILVSAAECNYTRLGPHIEQDLMALTKGIGGKPIEDLHRVLNVAKKQAMNLKLSRDSRWHYQMVSDVIADNEIRMPKIHSWDSSEAKKTRLDNASYSCDSSQFSLGEDVYKAFLKEDWLVSRWWRNTSVIVKHTCKKRHQELGGTSSCQVIGDVH